MGARSCPSASTYILFRIRDPGYCPDPGIPGTGSGGVRQGKWNKMRQALARQTFRGVPVETQERWRKHVREIPPAILRRDTAESAANRERTLCIHNLFMRVVTKLYASTVNPCVMIYFLLRECVRTLWMGTPSWGGGSQAPIVETGSISWLRTKEEERRDT